MGIEHERFRKLVGDWLLGISGLAGKVGTRVSSGWPAQPQKFPLVVFGTRRRPLTEHVSSAWHGELILHLFATTQADLDVMENAIVEDMDDGKVSASLTDAQVQCKLCDLTDIDEDAPTYDPDDASLLHIERTITLDVAFLGLVT